MADVATCDICPLVAHLLVEDLESGDVLLRLGQPRPLSIQGLLRLLRLLRLLGRQLLFQRDNLAGQHDGVVSVAGDGGRDLVEAALEAAEAGKSDVQRAAEAHRRP